MSEIICEREEKKLVEKDLLAYLTNFKDQRGNTLTKDQIADNIIGVLFAAQDTTASALTWILKYLHDDQKLLEAVKVKKSIKFYILQANIICFRIISTQFMTTCSCRQSKMRYMKRMMEGRGP